MVRYSWWRGSLGVIFMASYFTHGIFDPLSCTGTQWIVDKVMLEHSLHSVLICDIPTVIFQLDCSRAAVCPCTLFRVRCRPHSEGCDLLAVFFNTFPDPVQIPQWFRESCCCVETLFVLLPFLLACLLGPVLWGVMGAVSSGLDFLISPELNFLSSFVHPSAPVAGSRAAAPGPHLSFMFHPTVHSVLLGLSQFITVCKATHSAG